MVDIAHIADCGGGLHPSPVPYADFVTTTTHKTLRGPRGGVIMCKEAYAKQIDKAVFPGTQGGPLMHIIAAKAAAFKEALSPEFKEYQKQILSNAQAMAARFIKNGIRLVSGGTDNHLMLLDLRETGVTGKELEFMLDRVHITVNKNTIPFETASPFVTSGIRVGTPAVTTRGHERRGMRKNRRPHCESDQRKGKLFRRGERRSRRALRALSHLRERRLVKARRPIKRSAAQRF